MSETDRTWEKVGEFLKLDTQAEETVSRLTVHPHRVGYERSFYNQFALIGLHVDRMEPGFVSCTFKVPPRLTDKNGNLATGAIANLVDEIGSASVFVICCPMKVSVDMSISFLGTAKLDDELEILSRALGDRGRYCGTSVVVRNKATGEFIAEGRHSLFGEQSSKL